MNKSGQNIYEFHNNNCRGEGFSILREDRGRLFAKNIGTGKKILDLGCRDGALTSFFVKNNDVTGADIDTIALDKASKRGIKPLHFDINGEWEQISQNKYDVVVIAETLEHIYYPEKVIQKIKSVLNKEGMLIGSVPNAFSLINRIRLFLGKKDKTPLHDPTHINHFSHKELKQILHKYFKEVTIEPLGRFAYFDKFMPGMFSFDLVFICSKPC
jgi:2-polyprenyl-3-methyl-5-hydroxy-6-metoxy-1,4-benzoquinol methylase